MPQLSFKWPASTSYAPEDFMLSAANEEAAHFLETWPRGHTQAAALLSGPEACGKTHLAQGWAQRTRAIMIDAEALGSVDSAALWQDAHHAVLENVHTIAQEAALFHLLRHSESHGHFLLLTSRMSAREMPVTLPDLRSRILSLPTAHIHAPDETLLKGYLLKCFADRQLAVSDEVTSYLVRRTERSFAAARALVEAVEARALEEKRDITIPFIRHIMG